MNDEFIVQSLCCVCFCNILVSTKDNMRKAKCDDCKDCEDDKALKRKRQ